jgi:hypothetical protein
MTGAPANRVHAPNGFVLALYTRYSTCSEGSMTRTFLSMAALALSITACKKTANGTYVIQKPVLGTVTDTVHTPVIQTGVDTSRVAVPKLQVRHDSETIKVPTLKISKP